MTREDIIRMAQKAGWTSCASDIYPPLERFAELVAAAEREQMQKEGWRQCAVGQRTTQFCGLLEQAVAAERERLNKKIAALESDVDHFFKLSGQYLERANKAEEQLR